jgi:hypothetical protein
LIGNGVCLPSRENRLKSFFRADGACNTGELCPSQVFFYARIQFIFGQQGPARPAGRIVWSLA